MSALPSAPSISFQVIDRFCPSFTSVCSAFERLIVPIYGRQDRAIAAIGAGEDRLCEMLLVNGEPKGLLVYKKEVTRKSELELKTLCLLEPARDSRLGYGSLLYTRLTEIARTRGAAKIFVTVSSARPEAKEFFVKKGFVVTSEKPDFYTVGQTEYFLSGAVSPAKSAVKVEPVATHKPALALSAVPAVAGHGAGAGTSSVIPRRSAAPVPFPAPSVDHAGGQPGSHKRARGEEEEAVLRTQGGGGSGSGMAGAGAGGRSFQERGREAVVRPFAGSARPPKHHECTLRKEYIDLILSGRKTAEGRVDTAYFRDYLPGDTVTWSAGSWSSATTKITSRIHYPSFDAMLKGAGYQTLVPNVRSHGEALSIYNSIPGYAEKVYKFGAIAFGLQLVQEPARAAHSAPPERRQGW